jgi:sugar transferase (PEP-CTERM/EpsH1 system associated)
VGALSILLVSPWMPWPPHDGGRIRILNTLRHLARQHRVTLVAPARTPRDAAVVPEVAALCEEVVTTPLSGGPALVARALRGVVDGRPLIQTIHEGRPLAERIRRLTVARPFDIVQVEFSWFAPTLRALHEHCRARTVLTMHNVESLRFARELRSGTSLARRLVLGWDQRFGSGWEQEAVRTVDGVAVVSDTERQWVERAAPATIVAVAPNGVDTEHFRPLPVPAHGPLVFTGAMDYPPNVDAVVWFCRDVWPGLRRRSPDLRLDVVGRAPTRPVRALDGRMGVRVTGEVPDVRRYLANAGAVIVPLRAGGGTRLKILEAMAMGRPVISTTLGAEGLDVAAGSEIVLADTPDDFARAIERVITSPETARRLGAAGRRLAVARYDWQHCLQPLDTLYARLLEREPAVATGRAS